MRNRIHLAASACQMAALAVTTAAFVLLAPPSAYAQAEEYPNKTIKILVGPSPDVVPRVIGEHLQGKWGQAIVVEPRPGAGGQIAATAVINAEPDGYTFLFATPSYTLNTAMKSASYDVLRDFAPVALISTAVYTLVVHPSVPAKTFAELIELAKAKPGTLNCASAGMGTAPHLACETFNTIPGVKVVHVPYRNVNEAMNGVVAGQVQMFVSVSLVAKQQILAGTVRGIATTGSRRSALLPDLPTIADAGYPNIVLTGWNGLLTAKATPKPILEKVNAEVARGVALPAVRERLSALGSEFPEKPLAVDEFGAFLRDDVARWSKMVEAAKIQAPPK